MFSITILCSMHDIGGTMINPILHYTTVNKKNINNPTQIKDNRHSSHNCNRKLTHKPHARIDGGPCTRSGDSTCRAGRRASTTAPEHLSRCPRPRLQVHRVMRPPDGFFPIPCFICFMRTICVCVGGFSPCLGPP